MTNGIKFFNVRANKPCICVDCAPRGVGHWQGRWPGKNAADAIRSCADAFGMTAVEATGLVATAEVS